MKVDEEYSEVDRCRLGRLPIHYLDWPDIDFFNEKDVRISSRLGCILRAFTSSSQKV